MAHSPRILFSWKASSPGSVHVSSTEKRSSHKYPFTSMMLVECTDETHLFIQLYVLSSKVQYRLSLEEGVHSQHFPLQKDV